MESALSTFNESSIYISSEDWSGSIEETSFFLEALDRFSFTNSSISVEKGRFFGEAEAFVLLFFFRAKLEGELIVSSVSMFRLRLSPILLPLVKAELLLNSWNPIILPPKAGVVVWLELVVFTVDARGAIRIPILLEDDCVEGVEPKLKFLPMVDSWLLRI